MEGGGEDTGRTRKCLQRMMEKVGHSEEKREREREKERVEGCVRETLPYLHSSFY